VEFKDLYFPGFYYCIVDVGPSDTAQSVIEMKSINQAHLPLKMRKYCISTAVDQLHKQIGRSLASSFRFITAVRAVVK
jgi:hypothetical protein